MLGHYVKWQDKKTPGKKHESNKTAIERKIDRWNKTLDTLIVKDNKDSHDNKTRRPGSGLM